MRIRTSGHSIPIFFPITYISRIRIPASNTAPNIRGHIISNRGFTNSRAPLAPTWCPTRQALLTRLCCSGVQSEILNYSTISADCSTRQRKLALHTRGASSAAGCGLERVSKTLSAAASCATVPRVTFAACDCATARWRRAECRTILTRR